MVLKYCFIIHCRYSWSVVGKPCLTDRSVHVLLPIGLSNIYHCHISNTCISFVNSEGLWRGRILFYLGPLKWRGRQEPPLPCSSETRSIVRACTEGHIRFHTNNASYGCDYFIDKSTNLKIILYRQKNRSHFHIVGWRMPILYRVNDKGRFHQQLRVQYRLKV